MTGLQIGGLDYFFKEANQILILRTNSSKVPTKNEPFAFIFSKSTNKNLRVQIPVIIGGWGGGGREGADNKWSVPKALLG